MGSTYYQRSTGPRDTVLRHSSTRSVIGKKKVLNEEAFTSLDGDTEQGRSIMD